MEGAAQTRLGMFTLSPRFCSTEFWALTKNNNCLPSVRPMFVIQFCGISWVYIGRQPRGKLYISPRPVSYYALGVQR